MAGPSIFASFMRGEMPSEDELFAALERAVRPQVEKYLGRALSEEEVAQAREYGWKAILEAVMRRSYSPPPSGSSSSSSSTPPPRSGPDPREQARAREAAERERAKKIGWARRTLGFSAKEDLSPEKLKARYREIARRHHPDRNPDREAATRKMQDINLAMEVLSGGV